MKLEEFSNITCKPSVMYIYNTDGKVLLKTTNTNVKNHDFVRFKEVVSIEATNLAWFITIKE